MKGNIHKLNLKVLLNGTDTIDISKYGIDAITDVYTTQGYKKLQFHFNKIKNSLHIMNPEYNTWSNTITNVCVSFYSLKEDRRLKLNEILHER